MTLHHVHVRVKIRLPLRSADCKKDGALGFVVSREHNASVATLFSGDLVIFGPL